jgi:hypothetical protein
MIEKKFKKACSLPELHDELVAAGHDVKHITISGDDVSIFLNVDSDPTPVVTAHKKKDPVIKSFKDQVEDVLRDHSLI